MTGPAAVVLNTPRRGRVKYSNESYRAKANQINF